jgi:PAS domain S-box-containing protein
MGHLHVPAGRIQFRLMLVAALSLLPAIAVIVGTQWFARQNALQGTIAETRRLAKATASNEATVFIKYLQLLQTLSDVALADGNACTSALQRVRDAQFSETALFVMDGRGAVVCPASSPNSYADREWFQRTVTTRRPVLGDFQISRFSGKPVVVMALPSLDATSGIKYVYAASLNLSELERFAAKTPLPNSSILTLMDRDRTILVRHPGGDQWVGKRAPGGGAAERIQRGAEDDVREDVGIDNVRRLWATVPVPIGIDSGLLLGIGVPSEVAFADANNLLRRSAVLFVVLIVATAVVTWEASDLFVVRPLAGLAEAMRRLARGDLAARAALPTAVPGLRQVSLALNEMAEALEGRHRDHATLQLLARAIESTNDLVSVTDPANRFTFVNQAFLKTYGYTSDEVLGQTPSLLLPADLPPGILDEIIRQTEEGGWHGQLVNRRKDGSQISVHLDTSLVRSDNGEVIGLLGVARDITNILKSEQALRDIQERLRFALVTADVGIWEQDIAGARFFWSELQEKLHGVPTGTFAGTMDAYLRCIHPDDRQHVRETLARISQHGGEAEFEYRTESTDHTERWVRASARYLVDNDGVVTRGAGITVDVTERRNLEAQLQQSQKMEAIGLLAGGIAHDFNNMLTTIIGYSGLLLDGLPEGDPRRGELEQIHRAGLRSADLTRQLLAFSRKQILTPTVLRVGEVVSNVTTMLRRLIGERIQLSTAVADRHSVKADAGQLEQVLVNLVVNARDAMPDGGALTIETTDVVVSTRVRGQEFVEPGSYAVITVRDTGVGMDAATQARVFEPFFTTKAKGRGTGLGLATVYGIVKQSGGYVVVSSQPGAGSSFSVYLPHTNEQPIKAEKPVTRVTGGTETILLVEDEEMVREYTKGVLERAGYTVFAAKSSAAAQSFAASYAGAIDLILSDMILTDGTGRDTAADVRVSHPEVRIAFISGYTEDALPSDDVAHNSTLLLSKPFTVSALLAHVRLALAATP